LHTEETRVKEPRGLVVALALALDLLLGEPPERWHPVVWMGRLIGALERRAPKSGRIRQLLFGAAMEAICVMAAALPARLLNRVVPVDSLPGILLRAISLKPTFALRALFDHHSRVGDALARSDLNGARRAVGAIVSREVGELEEVGVVAAAVESLAENAADSVVAPLLYYTLFGLPGAYLYRAANTLDAMVGYHGRYEYLGKVAARADDTLNLVPARLAAVAMAAGSCAIGSSPRSTWVRTRREASRTESPNAGWPMAAVAGALDVRLEKVGHYVLHPAGRTPTKGDLRRARRVVGAGLAVAILGLILVGGGAREASCGRNPSREG